MSPQVLPTPMNNEFAANQSVISFAKNPLLQNLSTTKQPYQTISPLIQQEKETNNGPASLNDNLSVSFKK